MTHDFWIDIFTRLGHRLESFGSDSLSRDMISRAVVENRWFSERGMLLAISAIREQMLDREKLVQWVAGYGSIGDPALPFPASSPGSTGRTLGIIMAGNIPFVGFADLLYGLFCGYECYIHTSSKDSHGMMYIADLLEDITHDIHIGRTIPPMPDALIATGSDSTIHSLREQYPDVRALFRGTRSSIAVLSGNETSDDLISLADDIFMYNGLGCRNVSLLFVSKNTDMQYIADIFRNYGSISPAYRNNYLQNRALTLMDGIENVIDGGFFTLSPGNNYPLYISRINYVTYTDLEVVEQWIAEHETSLQCIVSNFFHHPATVPLGHSQRPGLSDYADRCDVVKFLLDL